MLLKELNHKNIVKLIEVVTDKQILPNGTMTDADDGWKGVLNSKEAEREPGVSFFMVMEYADHDLSGLIKKKLCTFTEPIIKDLIQQLLEGICYCHEHGVIHRDIKPSNLLLTSDGTLKIIDFGLAKKYAPGALMTLTVITLWYRAPEILLGDLNYGFPVDMWSIGCILAELFLGKPVLQGKAEAQQLDTIIRSCGEITEATWPGVSKLPGYEAIIQNSVGGGKSVSDTLKGIVPPMAMDLILSLLALDPAKRPTARMALDHPWFKSDPKPQKLIIENPEPEKGLVVSPVKQQPPPQKQQKSIPQFLLDPPK